MPLPNDSDTYSGICNTKENPIYLILTSVANMGICLSKLIDAQALEIHLLASDENDSKLSIPDIIALNKSIQRILKKACMLQMLLQLKLEYVNKLKCIYAEPADSHGIGETDGSADAIAAIRDMGEKAKKKLNKLINPFSKEKALRHCLKGRGHGRILKHLDPFYDGIATIQIYMSDNDSKDNFLYYTAMKGTRMMNFTAYPNSLITASEVTGGSKKIKIEGIGSIIMKERFKPDKRDIGSFEITICFDTKEKEKKFFDMAIKATGNADFGQMSGKIEAECSNLHISAEH